VNVKAVKIILAFWAAMTINDKAFWQKMYVIFKKIKQRNSGIFMN